MSPVEAMPGVDVVIVNWNTGPYLARCLESLTESTGHHDLCVTVVDNASSDGSADPATLAVPGSLRLRVLRNTENRGFAAACNQGARIGEGEYLLFLNPDAAVAPDAIQRCVDFLSGEAGQTAGICGGAIVDEDGAPSLACARFPALRTVFGRMTGASELAPRRFPPHHMSPSELRQTRQVDQVIGAFYFVRRSLWEQLGGFDESFFMYYEEVDFALRALSCGWSTWYLNDVRVTHVGNVSSAQVRSSRTFYSLRSRAIYARKHWSGSGLLVLVVLSLTLEPVARLALVTKQRDWASAREICVAYQRYARTIPRVITWGDT
jgi:GT2 family glycosyltransferase